MKKEGQFKIFLKRRKGHSDKGIKSRVALIKTVEKEYSLEIDDVVKDDEKTYLLLCKIKKNQDRNGRKQNAVRAYYEMNNGKEFPKLDEYSLSIIAFHIKYKNEVPLIEFTKTLQEINGSLKEEKVLQNEFGLKDSQIKLKTIEPGSFWVQIGLPIIVGVVTEILGELVKILLGKLNKKKKKYKISRNKENVVEIEEL